MTLIVELFDYTCTPFVNLIYISTTKFYFVTFQYPSTTWFYSLVLCILFFKVTHIYVTPPSPLPPHTHVHTHHPRHPRHIDRQISNCWQWYPSWCSNNKNSYLNYIFITLLYLFFNCFYYFPSFLMQLYQKATSSILLLCCCCAVVVWLPYTIKLRNSLWVCNYIYRRTGKLILDSLAWLDHAGRQQALIPRPHSTNVLSQIGAMLLIVWHITCLLRQQRVGGRQNVWFGENLPTRTLSAWFPSISMIMAHAGGKQTLALI